MHTIDFAVEEATFRKLQDVHRWSESRWVLEREEFRERRLRRVGGQEGREGGEGCCGESDGGLRKVKGGIGKGGWRKVCFLKS